MKGAAGGPRLCSTGAFITVDKRDSTDAARDKRGASFRVLGDPEAIPSDAARESRWPLTSIRPIEIFRPSCSCVRSDPDSCELYQCFVQLFDYVSRSYCKQNFGVSNDLG